MRELCCGKMRMRDTPGGSAVANRWSRVRCLCVFGVVVRKFDVCSFFIYFIMEIIYWKLFSENFMLISDVLFYNDMESSRNYLLDIIYHETYY